MYRLFWAVQVASSSPIRLSPQQTEERQQQASELVKKQKLARAKGEAGPPTPRHLDFLDPELPPDEVADAHTNVLIQLYHAYTAQFSAVLAHLAYVREKTRIETMLRKRLGPVELSPETGGPSVAELVGPLEAWHHGKNIATNPDSAQLQELETFNDILARALRGEDTGPQLTMQEQTRVAAQKWEAKAAVDRAAQRAEQHVWDGNGPIRIFPTGFRPVTDQLQTSYYRSVTDQ